MSRFRSDLVMVDDGGTFTLHEPLVYDSDRIARVVVPAGFRTDLASIPRGLWNVLPPIGRYDAAAVVHDHLYQHNGVSRSAADGVLLEAMCVLGVAQWQRWAIYAGVRVGGWLVWSRYRRQDAAVCE